MAMRSAFVVPGESSTRLVLGDDFAPFIQGGRRMRPDVLRRIAARTKSKLCGSEKKQPVVREFNGMKMVTKYDGKFAGDEIKGSIERPGRGEGQPPQKTDWLAKRDAAAK
jgi:hypothetical protein